MHSRQVPYMEPRRSPVMVSLAELLPVRPRKPVPGKLEYQPMIPAIEGSYSFRVVLKDMYVSGVVILLIRAH